MKKAVRHLGFTGCAALLMGAAGLAWAEAAPVYDVEAFEMAEQSHEMPVPTQPQGVIQSEPGASRNATVTTANMGMDQRMRQMEQQIVNMQNSDMPMQVESLQNQIQILRGQVEELTRQLEKMEVSQRTMYSDLDKRLVEIQASAKAAAAAELGEARARQQNIASEKPKAEEQPAKKVQTAKARPEQPDVAEEQKIYQTAYDYIKARKYGDAVSALEKMLKKYPDGQFASNAHYWLGELYGLMGESDKALQEFTVVLSKFPDSSRVSDAQLKIGLIFASQSKWASAKTAFRKVINSYPGTASSRLASEQLKQIKKAGH